MKCGKIYTETLSIEESRIINAFEKMFIEAGFEKPETIYGNLSKIETQITFSARGFAALIKSV